MANKQINDFTAKDPLADSDQFVIQETAGGSTKKALYSAVKAQKLSGVGLGEEIHLKSPDGTIWKLRIDDNGVLTQET